MLTTVVSVFIFLCGVLVGRGVRAEDIGVDSTVATSGTPAPVSEGQPVTSPPAAVAEQPAPAADSALTYADRLQRDKPASEDLKARSAAAKEEPRSNGGSAAETRNAALGAATGRCAARRNAGRRNAAARTGCRRWPARRVGRAGRLASRSRRRDENRPAVDRQGLSGLSHRSRSWRSGAGLQGSGRQV